MSKIVPQPGILDIALYQGGASHVDGVADVIKLSSNENPAGPSPAAIQALQKSAYGLHRYPSTDHAQLRRAIADHHGLDMDRIICGVGSDEVISFLCYAYAGVGDEVIHTEHGFAMYRISALAAGATPVEVAENNRVVDVDNILAACTKKTKLVFIANPGNPSGTFLSDSEVRRLAEGLPAHVLLVLDGAYAEFAPGFDGGATLSEQRENVVMTRTFSKLYGLGGLRVGWGYGPKAVIDVLNRLRGPFNLSGPALATAEAAIKDVAYAEKCTADNARMRDWITKALNDIGVHTDQSYANFVLARFDNADTADGCDAYLKSQGLIVRKTAGYKIPNGLRITIGDEAACRRVVHAIANFLESRK